jgi:hypothetical protein
LPICRISASSNPLREKFYASDIWNIEIWENGVKVVVHSTPRILLPIDLCGGVCRSAPQGTGERRLFLSFAVAKARASQASKAALENFDLKPREQQ